MTFQVQKAAFQDRVLVLKSKLYVNMRLFADVYHTVRTHFMVVKLLYCQALVLKMSASSPVAAIH